jgi:hypothetical protein
VAQIGEAGGDRRADVAAADDGDVHLELAFESQ